RAPGWRLFFLAGVLLGGVLYAVGTGGWQATLAYGALDTAVSSPAGRGAVLAAAGLLMGFGARTAGGCTSGHGLCGTALGSPASYVSTLSFMAAAIAGAHLIALLGGVR